jgi:hypothetical protein
LTGTWFQFSLRLIRYNDYEYKNKYIPATPKGKEIILIQFPYDKVLIERVKKLPGAAWSRTQKVSVPKAKISV